MSVSPPRPKGPPLNALRAFESAARLGGFAAAANELCVTSGAISQHVKALEAWVGTDLFERRSQGVRLTPLGTEILADFSAAFDRMGEAVQKLHSRARPNRIRIAALPSVAQLWLSPRLPAIREATPDIAISVTAMETAPNLKRDPFDLSIFFRKQGEDRGDLSLGPDRIFPVCSPAMAERLHHPSDLASGTLLHDASWSQDWALWLDAMGVDQIRASDGPAFSLYSLALEEAANGAGVLIGHDHLVQRHLHSGLLVAPFTGSLVLERHLSLSIANPAARNPVRDAILRTLTGSPVKF